jgi:hypothetical protein
MTTLDFYGQAEIIATEVGVDMKKAMEWCFKDVHSGTPIHMLDEIWNKYHSDIFIVKGTDPIYSTLEKMFQAYKKLIEPTR